MLPDGWTEKNIGDICDVKGGKRIPKGYSLTDENTGQPYIRVTDMKEGGVDLSDIKYVPKEVQDSIKRYVISKDDLFITVAGTLGTVGKIPKELDGANLTENADKLTNIKINRDYLEFYLRSPRIQNEIQASQTQNAQPKLAIERIKKFKIFLPERYEQEKIVGVLNAWVNAIDSLEVLLKQKQEQKKALMQRLLTGKHRFPEFEGQEWKKLKASKIFKSYSKKSNHNEPLLAVMQDIGVVPRDMLDRRVVMPEGSTDGYKLIEPRDFVISLRSFQGGLEYSRYRGIVSPAYTILKSTSPICDDFYRHYFKSYEFIGRLAVAVIGIRDGKQISYDDFSFMDLPCPDLKEQEKIAAVLNAADKEIALLTQKLEAYQEQKKGLMQQLLTGKKRVKIDRKEAA